MKLKTMATILACLLGCGLTVSVSAQEVEEEAEPTSGFGKGFFIQSEDGDYRINLRSRVQTRYTFESEDNGEGEERDEASYFSIQRARLKLTGHVFMPELDYALQMDFGRGFFTLKDYYVDYEVADGFHVRIGQYKRPFSRQQITSSGSQAFVDRAITDKAFGAGRDIGIAIHNNYTKSPEFEWAFGIFNGTGDKSRFSGSTTVDLESGEGSVSGSYGNVPDFFYPTLVLRLGYNYGGIKGYSEADLEGGPVRFSVGASALADLDLDDDGESSYRTEVDYILKASGFSTTGGFYYGIDEVGDESASVLGFHAQAGYMIGEVFQPAVRYAMVDPDGDDNETTEIGLSLNAFARGHNLKWQTDAAMISGGDLTDYRIRSQVQLAF